MSGSVAFKKLHKGVQYWIWKQGFVSLRDIQEQAIEPILRADCDVIISAATASGKTEAAFWPACSRVATLANPGAGILYISPLKALINDQYRRLQGLGEMLGLEVTPWHGDVLRSIKDKQKKQANGIILITPESLESLLLNRQGWCLQAFTGLSYIIIDEFHAFIGTERGFQLQALMHRLEFLVKRVIPRIALSATLGNMDQVVECLRPNQKIGKKFPCEKIGSDISKSTLKIQLLGYLSAAKSNENLPTVSEKMVHDLYRNLKNGSHLVFANSRGLTEKLASDLADRCEQDIIPNQFFPHHGNLSKEIREALETRLQKGREPTTAVCTMTLELGIDIGNVDSIAQVTAPPSVASLRQRLGRSGRRDKPAILRMFICENEITSTTHISDRLRIETFQCIAMTNLLLNKWYEPPDTNQYHLSTLVQQVLSIIGQYGGVWPKQPWELLCDTGPFYKVDSILYMKILRTLGEKNIISQTQDGQLVLGERGERLVEHYTFYAAFTTPEEYRLEFSGRVLGTVPVHKPLILGEFIIFSGKKWEVLNVNFEERVIALKPVMGGGRPPYFEGGAHTVHNRVRKEMFRIYRESIFPVYLDENGRKFFEQGVENFYLWKLHEETMIEYANTVYVFPWLGDQVTYTISRLFCCAGLSTNCFNGIIEVSHSSKVDLLTAIESILKKGKPEPMELVSGVKNTAVEKYDSLLSEELRQLNYGAKFFDVDGAWRWLTAYF